MKGVQFYLILGFFILAAAIGVFCCIQFYAAEPLLFWISVVWTLLYAIAVWFWLDKGRTVKYEMIMKFVIFGLLFLLMIAFAVAALWVFIPKIVTGVNVLENTFAMIIAEGSLILYAYIFYKHFLRESFRELTTRFRKGENETEDRDP